MPEECNDPNQMPEGREVLASLFQDGLLVATGKASRQGAQLEFHPSDQSKPPASLRPPITLTVWATNGVHKLSLAPNGADHRQCKHWSFEIVSD